LSGENDTKLRQKEKERERNRDRQIHRRKWIHRKREADRQRRGRQRESTLVLANLKASDWRFNGSGHKVSHSLSISLIISLSLSLPPFPSLSPSLYLPDQQITKIVYFSTGLRGPRI
jgi:hypothetical protein